MSEWEIEKYREQHESEEHWRLRKAFLLRWKNYYHEDRLVCLARLFINITLLGCRYSPEVMNEIAGLSEERIPAYSKQIESFTRAQGFFTAAEDGRGSESDDCIIVPEDKDKTQQKKRSEKGVACDLVVAGPSGVSNARSQSGSFITIKQKDGTRVILTRDGVNPELGGGNMGAEKRPAASTRDGNESVGPSRADNPGAVAEAGWQTVGRRKPPAREGTSTGLGGGLAPSTERPSSGPGGSGKGSSAGKPLGSVDAVAPKLSRTQRKTIKRRLERQSRLEGGTPVNTPGAASKRGRELSDEAGGFVSSGAPTKRIRCGDSGPKSYRDALAGDRISLTIVAAEEGVKLDADDLSRVRRLVIEMLLALKSGVDSVPRFTVGKIIVAGTIYVSCHNKETEGWVRERFHGMTLGNKTLRVIDGRDGPKPVRMVWKTKCMEFRDLNESLGLVRLLQPELNVDQWKFHNIKREPDAVLRYLTVDKASADYLRDHNYLVMVGPDIESIRLPKKKDKKNGPSQTGPSTSAAAAPEAAAADVENTVEDPSMKSLPVPAPVSAPAAPLSGRTDELLGRSLDGIDIASDIEDEDHYFEDTLEGVDE